jgi:glycosyltransferase involved in cell wall biosynthesis
LPPDALPHVDTLTAVYRGVAPKQLEEALRSLVDQTLRPTRCIVVADGPLTDELDAVLSRFAEDLPLKVIRLPRNLGSGPARQAGLAASEAPLVAIADADDISLPTRLEREAAALRGEGLDIVGSAVEEFDGDDLRVLGVRRFASGHDELRGQLRTVNPFNHPSVMMSRQRALDVGGYRSLPYLEDYDLCARFAAAGCRMGNLDEVLVRFRGGEPSQRRRRIGAWFAAEVQLQRNLHRYGLIPWWQMGTNLLIRSSYRILPDDMRRRAYERVFLSRQRRRGHAASAKGPIPAARQPSQIRGAGRGSDSSRSADPNSSNQT